jgi:hypothetical protein
MSSRPMVIVVMKLLDIMCFTCATAIGLTLSRLVLMTLNQQQTGYALLLTPITFVLLPWSFCVVGLRSLQSGSDLVQIMRQPGMAANATVVCMTLYTVLLFLLQDRRLYHQSLAIMLSTYALTYSSALGSSVALVWLGSLLSGRWKLEPTWDELLCLVVGSLWLLLLLICWLAAGDVTLSYYRIALQFKE